MLPASIGQITPNNPPAAAPVLRERDWGDTDIFGSLRTSFTSSGLAGMGGVAPVDFIAPAEHMKRLITLPYTPGRVAFPVHRVGNSLVIDGGVRPNAGRSSAASGDAGEAAERLLADVLGKLTVGTSGGALPAPPAPAATAAAAAPAPEASAAALVVKDDGGDDDGWTAVRGKRRSRRSQELLSKFLCHSVASGDGDTGGEQPRPASINTATAQSNLLLALEEPESPSSPPSGSSDSPPESPDISDSAAANAEGNAETRWTLWREKRGEDNEGSTALTTSEPPPPTKVDHRMQKREAAVKEAQEQRAAAREPPHPFRQVVHWQLQDLGDALGTDQLLFSSLEYPAMSLQLMSLDDMKKPIRPLTILEYWLDNVMAAIPALAVCGHVDGRVKGYHVFKTDDLPHWPGASFDPDAVLGNAHQLLNFLQHHCTRPGGSYWVLKEPEANYLRVFDLATLSSEYGADANPFSHSVALMCFRMARRPPLPRPSDEGEEGDESPADDSRETVEKRRELLTQCAELLNREEQPLLHSLVQLQLARCSAALGVDEEAIAKHPDVMRVLRAAAEKTSAAEESSAPPPSSPQPQEDEDGGRTALVRRPSREVILGVEGPPSPGAPVSAHPATPPQPPGTNSVLRLLRALHGALPRAVWPQASVLGHALSGLESIAQLSGSAASRCEQALKVELPELEEVSVSSGACRTLLVCAGCCLDVARALSSPESSSSRPTAARRLCAVASLMLLRAGANGLSAHVFGQGVLTIPPASELPSPLDFSARPPSPPTSPGANAASPSELEARANLLLQHVAQQYGDAMRELAHSAPSFGSNDDGSGCFPVDSSAINDALKPLGSWLRSIDVEKEDVAVAAVVLPRERNHEDAADCLHGACESYWWLLNIISAREAAGDAPPAQQAAAPRSGTKPPPVQPQPSWRSACTIEALAMRPHAIRRLGAVLNELGQLQMRSGHLGPADALFLDSLSAFTEVDDAANAALLLLNRAAIARQRALRFERAAQAAAQQASEAEGAQAAAQAAAQAGNTGGELHHLLEVVEHQRAARRQLKSIRGGGPAPLRAMVFAILRPARRRPAVRFTRLLPRAVGRRRRSKRRESAFQTRKRSTRRLGSLLRCR